MSDRPPTVIGHRRTILTVRASFTENASRWALYLSLRERPSAGLFLLGLGLSPVFPVVYGVVGGRDPADAGRAIAAVTTIGYLGSVVGPPSIGALAEFTGLRVSFILLAVATAMRALLSPRLAGNGER